MLIVQRMVAASAMQPPPQPTRCEQQQRQACGDGEQDAMLPQEVAQGFHCGVAVPAAASSLEVLVRAAASTTPKQHGSLGGTYNGGSGELGVVVVVKRSTISRIRKFEMSFNITEGR